MTKAEEILEEYIKWFADEHTVFGATRSVNLPVHRVVEAMEKYAKYHSALAFDAGFDLCSMYETNFPANALTKEEYLSKTFNS